MNFRSRNTISNIFTLTICYGFCFLVNTGAACISTSLWFIWGSRTTIQGNYDYIMDVKFREDGEINVETRFAGYPESLGRHMWAGVGVRYMKSMCDLFGGFRQPADVHPTWMKITHGLSEVDFAVISRLKAVKVEVYIVGVFSLLYLSFP